MKTKLLRKVRNRFQIRQNEYGQTKLYEKFLFWFEKYVPTTNEWSIRSR